MKKILLILSGIMMLTGIMAQVPQGITHQAVMRDSQNQPIVESPIGVRISILQGGVDGEAVYVETHNPITNANGLITYVIGQGAVESGVFAEINWTAGPYFLKTESDPSGGTDYIISGVTQFLSVPYAIHASTAETAQSAAVAENVLGSVSQNILPPKAIATEAADIGESSAILNGIVNGEGFSTTVVFEWGTTTAYGNTITAVQSPVTGSDDVTVHADLTGLQAATTYHYRIKATNAVNLVYSNNMTFTTDAPAMYSLSLEVNPEGAGSVSGAGEYQAAQPVNIFATANEGWQFVNWTGDIEHIDDVASAETTVTMPASDLTLFASFEMVKYTLTLIAEPEDGGELIGAGDYYAGTSVVVGAIPNAGYTFVNWTLDGNVISVEEYDVIEMPAEDLTLIANFEEEPIPVYMLTLIANPVEGGEVFGAGTYVEDEEVQINAIPNQGWEFVNWTGDVTHIDDPDSETATITMPAADVTLTANFQEAETEFAQLTITVICDLTEIPIEGAWVDLYSLDNDFYFWGQTDENGKVILPDIPQNIYYLWVEKQGYDWYWFEFEMGNEDMEIVVHLTPSYFELSLSANPTEGGTVVGAGEYLMGEEVHITAVEEENWLFGRWTGDIQFLQADIYSSLNTIYMPDQDVSLEARFYGTVFPTVEISMLNNSQPLLTIVEAVVHHDPGADDSARGFVWSTQENPSLQHNEGISDDHGTGLGEFFIEFTDLNLNTKYYIRAYATNSEGTAYSDQHSFHFWDYHDTVYDIDNNVYQTVIIGNQEWMAENLRVTRYNNEDDIPTGLSDSEWESTTSGAYAIYDHNHWSVDGINSPEEMVAAYGKLYNWYAVDDARGLCPEGWSVPSHDDWTVLVNYVVSQGFPNSNVTNGAGNALKSCRQVNSPEGGDCDTSEHPRWNSHSTHYGFDEFGFSALPGGYRWSNGSFDGVGSGGLWWSATVFSGTYAWNRFMDCTIGDVNRFNYNKSIGFTVRCLRDTSEEPTLYNLHLEVHPEGAGTVFGAGEYEEGELVNVTATANEGWEFVNWTDNDGAVISAIANFVYTMPPDNVTLTANFQEKESDIIYGNGVTDMDDNFYTTVIIGSQEWMAENLRVTKFNNGDDIPTGLSNADWSSTISGAYAIYPHGSIPGLNSDEEVLEAYGALYNWYAVDDTRGLCPEGWSVPSDDDWTALVNYVVSQGFPNEWDNPNGAGNALKSCRQVGHPDGGDCDTSEHPRWNSHGTHSGFDEFGFSALPGGIRWSVGSFGIVGATGYWWIASELSGADAWIRGLYSSGGGMSWSGYDSKRHGFSVRCFRDID